MQLDFKSLGARIKDARIRKGLTQEQLAERVNLSPAHMCNIENGNATFRLKVFVDIANALSVRPDELLCDSIEQSREIYSSEAHKILSECTIDEVRLLTDMMKHTLNTHRKIYRSHE